MIKNLRLGTKITLAVSVILVVLLFSSVAAYVYVESRKLEDDVKATLNRYWRFWNPPIPRRC